MTKTSTLSLVQKTVFVFAVAIALVLSGCATNSSDHAYAAGGTNGTPEIEPLTLREGDIVTIAFPGAPDLNRREVIKRDGKIALLKGEITAAGKTLAELQKEVLDLYKDELVTKVVVVSLEASQFPIYVTGAVGHAGRLTVDRPMTALEAVMEASVDITRANLKSVRVTRNVNGKTEIFMLNLDRLLKGNPKAGEPPFYVKPSDIIYVPEKFQWF